MELRKPVITPPEANIIIDGIEPELIAYRLAHAVARYNEHARAEGLGLASFEVYSDPNEAEPPIDALLGLIDPSEKQVFTRMSYPDEDALDAIQVIEIALTRTFIRHS